MVYVGVDLGGTNIAVGVVSEAGSILSEAGAKTLADRPYQAIVRDMAELVRRAVAKARLTMDDVRSVGVGIPGVAFADTGVVYNCTNLGWINVPLRAELKKYIDKPIFIDNDANAAALAESVAGASAGCKSSILLTLGTGVGGGFIYNGHLYRGGNGCGFEPGHMTIRMDGVPCTCGKKGCFESYASASAIIRELSNSEAPSLKAFIAENGGKPTARMLFDAVRQGNTAAQDILDNYVKALAVGIGSLVTILRPQIVLLGGGVSAAGDLLYRPLRAMMKDTVFGYDVIGCPEIVPATLGNDAGIIGAAMLGK